MPEFDTFEACMQMLISLEVIWPHKSVRDLKDLKDTMKDSK